MTKISKVAILHTFCLLATVIAFDCEDIPNKTLCSSIDGCKYDNSESKCIGEIEKPECKYKNCFYVYNPTSINEKQGKGTLKEPYTQISQAIKEGIDIKITIINLNVDQYLYPFKTSINSKDGDKFTLTTLFKKQNPVYILPPNDDTFFRMTEGSSKLYLQNIIFISNDTSRFSVLARLTDCEITMRNVGFKDFPRQSLIFTDYSSFDIDGLWVQNTSGNIRFGAEEKKEIKIQNVTIRDISDKSVSCIDIRGDNISISDMLVQNVSVVGQSKFGKKEFNMIEIQTLHTEGQEISIQNITMKDMKEVRPILIQDMSSAAISDLAVYNSSFMKFGGLIDIEGIVQNAKKNSLKLNNVSFVECEVNENAIKYTHGKIDAKYITFNNLKKASATGKFNILLENTIYGVCMYLNQVQSNMMYIKASFINHHCIVSRESGPFSLTKSIFDNQKLNSQQESNEVSWVVIQQIEHQTFAYIKDNVFNTNSLRAESGGAIRFSIKSGRNTLWIEDSIILNVLATNGGGIAIEDFQDNGYYFSRLTFVGNQAFQDGGAIYNSLASTIVKAESTSNFEDLIFVNCMAKNQGGALKINQRAIKSLNHLIFYSNFAQYGGAFSVLTREMIIDSHNVYLYNQAGTFGGRSFDLSHQYDSKGFVISHGNIDPQNESDYRHPSPVEYKLDIYSIQNTAMLALNSQINLVELIKNDNITTLEESKKFQSSFNSLSKDLIVIPGHGLPKMIVISVLDSNGSVTNVFDKFSLKLSITPSKNQSVLGTGDQGSQVMTGSRAQFMNGKAYIFNNVILSGKNNTQWVLNIDADSQSTSIFKDLGLLLHAEIGLKFTECQIGDTYISQTNTCNPCPQGSYSLENPYNKRSSCRSCPTNFICLGGASIGPVEGFFRYDNTSTQVIECPRPDICKGAQREETFNPSGFCQYPHEGNLCANCAGGFARITASYDCIECSDTSYYYFKICKLFLVQLITIIIFINSKFSQTESIKKGFRGESNEEVKQEVDIQLTSQTVMKILLNFNITVSIINNYKVEWPRILTSLYGFIQDLVPSVGKDFSVYCFAEPFNYSQNTIFYLNYLGLLLQPILLLTIVVFGSFLIKVICKKRFNNQQSKKYNFSSIFILIGFFFQPTIVQESLQLLYCINLGDDQNPAYFLKNDPNQECWGEQHTFWALFAALPAFIIWGLLLPFLLFQRVRQNFQENSTQETLSNYYFIVGGYKDQYYWWEFIVMLRKIMLVLILVGLNGLHIQGQIFVTGITLTVTTFLHIQYSPYKTQQLNQLETISLSATVAMTACEIYFISIAHKEIETPLGAILSFCALFITAILVIKGGILYSSSIKLKAEKVKKKISEFRQRGKTLQKKEDQQDERAIELEPVNEVL